MSQCLVLYHPADKKTNKMRCDTNCLTDWADEFDGNQSDFSFLSDLIASVNDLVTAESPAGYDWFGPWMTRYASKPYVGGKNFFSVLLLSILLYSDRAWIVSHHIFPGFSDAYIISNGHKVEQRGTRNRSIFCAPFLPLRNTDTLKCQSPSSLFLS